VDAIPDIFKTLNNVTGNMAALTIVARFVSPKSLEPQFFVREPWENRHEQNPSRIT
jgi:Na+/H+-dicarboxylate symporter